MNLIDISAVAKASGLPSSTLRYYESLGLIRSEGRRGLKRLFDKGVLERLALISLSRWAGFSLEEIAQWFGRDGSFQVQRQLLEQKADEVEKRAAQLQALAEIIRHTAQCPAENHMACPKFRKMLKIARRHRPHMRPPLLPRAER